MNREQKIAIIIGFAVILVVGVLLSDHWSRARQLEIADAREGDAVQYTQQPVAVLTEPEPEIRIPVANRQATRPTESGVSPEARSIAPVIISQGAGSSAAPAQPNAEKTSLADALASTATRQQGLAATQSGVGKNPDSPSGSTGLVRDMVSKFRKSYAGSVPQAARVVDREPKNSDAITQQPQRVLSRPSSTPKVANPSRRGGQSVRTAAQMIRHKVASGETLSKIASKYLGSAGKWRVIANANPKLVTHDGRVREGVILLIPVKNVPREVAAAGQPSTHAPNKPSHTRTASGTTKSTRVQTYTVKKNDTLGQIAQKLLGSTRRINDLLKANRSLITDPDDIRIGMVLKIPSA